MKQLAYPFLDRRVWWLVIGVMVLNALYYGTVLCWIGLIAVLDWSTPQPGAQVPLWMGMGPMLVLQLATLLTGVVYLGALLATNREGLKRSGRLPEARWGRMLSEGLVTCFFAGLGLMLPYMALYFVTACMVFALFGITHLMRGVNDGLGWLTAVLGAGGIGLAFMLALFLFILTAWTIFPLLQARYAATGEFSSFFRLFWALRTIALAPGRFLLYQLPVLLFFSLGGVLYVVTLGLGVIVLMPMLPFVQLNQAYLMGHYYSEFVDPAKGDIVPAQV